MKFNTDEYYNKVQEITESKKDYKVVSQLWKEVFTSFLSYLRFNEYAIDSLFEWGDFGHNWKDLHKENTEYAGLSELQLFTHFKGDLDYCSDRMSLDRLFRLHWLYKQSFIKAMSKGDK